MILEELEYARKRGARILAEIAGYGMSGDAYHMTQPAPEHEGGFRVMRNAVRDAGVTPDVVGYVNAHGTSTPIGDTLEAHAIRNFFGDRKIAVSSTKSMAGQGSGGNSTTSAGFPVGRPVLDCGVMARRIVTVGGGLMGLSAAFHLRRAEPGARITVLERQRVGAAASGASAAGVRDNFNGRPI